MSQSNGAGKRAGPPADGDQRAMDEQDSLVILRRLTEVLHNESVLRERIQTLRAQLRKAQFDLKEAVNKRLVLVAATRRRLPRSDEEK